MVDLILLIVICSLVCFGVNYATLYNPRYDLMTNQRIEVVPTDTEVLWFIRYYGNKWLPKGVTKPLYGCVVCMSSVYSSLVYWGFIFCSHQEINSLTILKWVVVVPAVAALNRFLNKIL